MSGGNGGPVGVGLRPDGALNGSEAAYAGFGALSNHAARLASWLSLRRVVRRGRLLSALHAGVAALARPRRGSNRLPARGAALRPHPVHAGHQLRRRLVRSAPRRPHRSRLGNAAVVPPALGVRRLLADAARDAAARLQLDHHHAADRGRGGERRAERWPRLRQGAALGLRQLHSGKLRRGPGHRAAWRCLGDADARGRHGADDRRRLPPAARRCGEALASHARASPHQPRRRRQARPLAVLPAVPACRERHPGKPRALLHVRHAALARARLRRRNHRRALGARRRRRDRAVRRLRIDPRALGRAAHADGRGRRGSAPLGAHGLRPAALGDGDARNACTP